LNTANGVREKTLKVDNEPGSERVYQVAGSIIAAGDGVRVECALTLAALIVSLCDEIRTLRQERRVTITVVPKFH